VDVLCTSSNGGEFFSILLLRLGLVGLNMVRIRVRDEIPILEYRRIFRLHKTDFVN